MAEQTLKPGWTRVSFGDVVKLNTDRFTDPAAAGIERYVGLEHIEPEDLRIRRWGLVAEGTTFTNRFRPGQVLFGKRRAYQRKVAVAEFEGVCSSDIYVFEPKDERLLPELLPFLCQTEAFYEHAVGTSAGSLSPRTNWTQLANCEFALPPLEEQRRIIHLLTNVELNLESLFTLESSTNSLEGAMTEALLSSVTTSPKSKLGELADVKYGLTVDKSRRALQTKIPYLRVANVQRGRLDLSEMKEIGFVDLVDQDLLLQQGDILVVEGHAIATEVGRAVIWNNEIEKCSHQNHLIRVRVDGNIDSAFLVIYVNSTFGRSYFLQHAKSTSGLNTINSTVVRDLPIPLMSRDQQRYLVETLRSIQAQRNAVRERLVSMARLKSHLLTKLS